MTGSAPRARTTIASLPAPADEEERAPILLSLEIRPAWRVLAPDEADPFAQEPLEFPPLDRMTWPPDIDLRLPVTLPPGRTAPLRRGVNTPPRAPAAAPIVVPVSLAPTSIRTGEGPSGLPWRWPTALVRLKADVRDWRDAVRAENAP